MARITGNPVFLDGTSAVDLEPKSPSLQKRNIAADRTSDRVVGLLGTPEYFHPDGEFVSGHNPIISDPMSRSLPKHRGPCPGCPLHGAPCIGQAVPRYCDLRLAKPAY